MEGLAVAAGITGVLAFAIEASKVIWETLSGIKEAPADVECLITAVNDLRSLLKQLEDLLDQNNSDGGTLSQDLELVIRRCALDLDKFQTQTGRLQALPNKKTWRGVKTVLEKKKLHSMRMVILQHFSVLGGHLAVANYKSSIDQHKQLTRLLTDTSISGQKGSSAIQALTQLLGVTTNQTEASFESISKQTADHQVSQKALNRASENLRQDIMAVTKNVETGNVAMHKKFESTSQSLDSLGDAVHRLSIGFSEGQIKSLTSLITSLQSKIPARDPKSFCSNTQGEACDVSDEEDREKEEDNGEAGHRFKLSLDRLARIAKDARIIAPSEEAQSVLEALETIFSLMFDKSSTSTSLNLKRKRTEDCDSRTNEADHEQEQKRIKGLLTTSQSIILNPKACGQNRMQCRYRGKRQTRGEVYKRSGGTLLLVSTTQKGTSSHNHQDFDEEFNCQHILQKYAGKATFWTADTTFPYKITATILQNLTCNGYYSLKPTLSYHAMIPFESEVFFTVETGNLLDLKHLLKEGKASVTDCDPDGRSLLNYASYNTNPDICKYLVEEGADLDSLEPTIEDGELIALLTYHHHIELCGSYFDRWANRQVSIDSQVCYRTMLLAGADPLFEVQGSSGLSYVLESGSSEDLQMLLHHGSIFIDPEEIIQGKPMLLFLCSRITPDENQIESLKVLLKFGVNVNATDEYGNTAIHLFLSHFYDDAHKFLMLLLQSIMETGADLHAKNNFGIEASHVAYRHLERDEYYYDSACVHRVYDDSASVHQRTRLWNEVLTASGLDIAEFRSSYRGYRYQSHDYFAEHINCDAFEKGAYLERTTLRPKVAANFFAGSSDFESWEAYMRRFTVEEIYSSDEEDDYTDGENDSADEEDDYMDGGDDYTDGENDFTDEENDSQAEPEDLRRQSSHNKITTTTAAATTNQEANNPAIPDTRSKTFWNVI